MAKKQSTSKARAKAVKPSRPPAPLQIPLTLLFIEPSFPGKLGLLADWLVRARGCRCWFAFHAAAPESEWPRSVGRGLELVPFNVGGVAREQMASWTRHLERSLCYAYGAWEVVDARRIRPIDAVIARSAGLGSSLFMPVSYPRIPIFQCFDYFFSPRSGDLADEDLPHLPPEYVMWRRSANAMTLLELENGVVPWTHSDWQRALFPPEYQSDLHVCPSAVDIDFWNPSPTPPVSIAGRGIDPSTKVLTFAASTLDRLRGFDRFFTLANRINAARPDVLCIAAGSPLIDRTIDVRDFGKDLAATLLSNSPPAHPDRLWITGRLDSKTLRDLFRRSDLHLALGRPYPCAQSLWQAMACGAPALATRTAPTEANITHDLNGFLVEPDDDAIFQRVMQLLDQPDQRHDVGAAGARFIHETRRPEQAFAPLLALLENATRVDHQTGIAQGSP